MSNFLNPDDYPFLKIIQNGFSTILEEYNSATVTPQPWHEGGYTGKWEVLGLKYHGKDVPETKILFPKTNEIFDLIKEKIHTCGFSILRPGCEISKHTDYDHNTLRCHLCLQTNPDCALVVNDEIKNWKVGELLLFDGLNTHYAYNRGKTDRVVVLFDFYKKGAET